MSNVTLHSIIIPELECPGLWPTIRLQGWVLWWTRGLPELEPAAEFTYNCILRQCSMTLVKTYLFQFVLFWPDSYQDSSVPPHRSRQQRGNVPGVRSNSVRNGLCRGQNRLRVDIRNCLFQHVSNHRHSKSKMRRKFTVITRRVIVGVGRQPRRAIEQQRLLLAQNFRTPGKQPAKRHASSRERRMVRRIPQVKVLPVQPRLTDEILLPQRLGLKTARGNADIHGFRHAGGVVDPDQKVGRADHVEVEV